MPRLALVFRERAMSLEQFVSKWTHPDYPPDAVAVADLDALESHFGFLLPEDYRQAVLAHGLPRPTLALLHSIAEADLDLADVGEFLSPGEAIETSDAWRGAGMPSNLVAFAMDSGGDLFCFDAKAGSGDRPASAAVWLWDHDDGAAEVVAESFSQWIEGFCRVDLIEEDA
jgi:cell wall assembly regulator SMI1